MYARRSRAQDAHTPRDDDEEEIETTEDEEETPQQNSRNNREARRLKRQAEEDLLDQLADFEELLKAPGYKVPTPTEMLVLKAISIQSQSATLVRIQNFIRAIRGEDEEETLVILGPHLKSLSERGLIKVDKGKRQTAGKPKNYYSITSRGTKAMGIIETFLKATQRNS